MRIDAPSQAIQADFKVLPAEILAVDRDFDRCPVNARGIFKGSHRAICLTPLVQTGMTDAFSSN